MDSCAGVPCAGEGGPRRSLVHLEQLEIVLGQLLHEALVRLGLADELAQHLQAVAQLDTFLADHVGQDEGSAARLALDGLDKDLATALKALVDETVGDAEVLLGVLLRLVIDLQIQVFEVAIALRISLASYVQDMGNAGFDEVTRFECCLERAHEDTLEHLE